MLSRSQPPTKLRAFNFCILVVAVLQILERFGSLQDGESHYARAPARKQESGRKPSRCFLPFLQRKKETSLRKLIGIGSRMPKRFRSGYTFRFLNRRRWCFRYVYSAHQRRVIIAWEARGKMPRCVPVERVLPPPDQCFWGTPESGKIRREAFLAKRGKTATAVGSGPNGVPLQSSFTKLQLPRCPPRPWKPCLIRHHRRWEDPALRDLLPQSKRRPRATPKNRCVIDAQIEICHFAKEDAPTVICSSWNDIKPVILLHHPANKKPLAKAVVQLPGHDACGEHLRGSSSITSEATAPAPSVAGEENHGAAGTHTASANKLLWAESSAAPPANTDPVEDMIPHSGRSARHEQAVVVVGNVPLKQDSLEAARPRVLTCPGCLPLDTTSTAETIGTGEATEQLAKILKQTQRASFPARCASLDRIF